MKVIKLSSALKDMQRVELAKAIKEGKIIIYPTDTLYGIGCNAEKSKSIEKILNAKGRGKDKSVSVIAPSMEWIAENTISTSSNLKFADNLLPGPYTVIMKTNLKLAHVVSKERKIGLRIPRNKFCDFIRSHGIPFVTTSVNISEEEPVHSLKDVPDKIKEIADYAIDAGEINGLGSRVFDISGGGLEIVRW